MSNWPTTLAAAMRRLVTKYGGRQGDPLPKLPRERWRSPRRMPRIASFARVVLVLATDPTAERWLPPMLFDAHAGSSDDLCVLG